MSGVPPDPAPFVERRRVGGASRVFTWAVLDALRKGDSNANGMIELSELVRHVQRVVPKIAADMGGAGRAATSEPIVGKQAPRFGSHGVSQLARDPSPQPL